MSFVGSNILAGASGQGDSGYKIERSLRFNSADSAYLNRTFSSVGNQRKFTFSFWLKPSNVASNGEMGIFTQDYATSPSNPVTDRSFFMGLNYNKLSFDDYGASDAPGNSGSSAVWGTAQTTAVFRDPTAWYHIVAAFDTTQATAADRVKLYVNGVYHAISGYPSQNVYLSWGQARASYICAHKVNGSFQRYMDGYLSDVHFIDGHQLAATDFGGPDNNNVWQPKKFVGNYSYTQTVSGTTTTLSQTGWNPSTTAAGNHTYIWNGVANGSNKAWGYAGGTGGTVSFSPALTNVTKVEIWTQNYQNYLNGVSVSTPESVNGGWHTLYDNSSSPITLVSVGNAYDSSFSQTVDLAGIRINGSIINAQTWTPPSGVGLTNGANSFHLDFADNSTVSALGTDTSGNSNNWTVSPNFSVTAGVGNDSLVDTPTNYGSDTGLGGEVRGNYCTMNPLHKENVVLSDGNLKITGTAGAADQVRGTMEIPRSGKWYFEFVIDNPYYGYVGVSDNADTKIIGRNEGGRLYTEAGHVSTPFTSFSPGNVIGVACDNNTTLTFYKNGVAETTTIAMDANISYTPMTHHYNAIYILNCGQRAWAYAPPSGYKALCTQNLDDPLVKDGSKYFDTILWNGQGNTNDRTLTTTTSADLVWTKARNYNYSLPIWDTVRGYGHKELRTDFAGTEGSVTGANFKSSTDTSITFEASSNGDNKYYNGGGHSYVGWLWDAGTIGANEVGSYWSPAYNTKYIGFKFPTSGGGRAVFGLESGTGTADIYTSTDNSSWTRVQQNVTLSTTDTTYDSSAQYLIVVNTTNAQWGAHHYAMATNGTDAHYSTSAYPGSGASFTWSGPGYTDWDFRSSGTVIKPGGLNTSVYNTSQPWSNYLSCASGFYSGYPASYAFDTSYGYPYVACNQTSGDSLVYTHPVATTVTSLRFRFYAGQSHTITVAGQSFSVSNVAGSPAWTEVLLPSGGISLNGSSDTITIAGPNWNYVDSIEINGKQLVDTNASTTNVPAIASTVRANPSAGFSIVTYTGNGSASASIAHGLNKAPEMFIVKSTSDAYSWFTYHKDLGNGNLVTLNSSGASGGTGYWANKTPTSNEIFLDGNVNTEVAGSGKTFVCYCFTSVEGYCKVGTFQGNASSPGPFVYLGFRPQFLLVKSTISGWWNILDATRDTYNPVKSMVFPNSSSDEYSGAPDRVNFLSNGFNVLSGSSDPNQNSPQIYLAIAEHPFKTSRAR